MGDTEKTWEVLMFAAAFGLVLTDVIGMICAPVLYIDMHRECNEQTDGWITGVRAVDA
jgi:hypothetical protein